MRKKYRQVAVQLEPDTRFEVDVAPAPFGSTTELEELKASLLKKLLNQVEEPGLTVPLHRAANEAASLAWFTPFPLLFFPVLLEEKVLTAQKQQIRQRQIRQRTEALLEKSAA